MSPFETFDRPARGGGRRTRPEQILPGDHDTMTDPQKRSHYTKGCTHAACRKAISDASNARQKARRQQRLEAAAVLAEVQRAGSAVIADARTGTRVTALGATRRIQGLMRVGHSPVAIALASQVGVDAVWWLALGKLDTIDEVTHRVIDRAYRRLRQELPEPRVKSAEAGAQLTAMCRDLGAELGWPGPFDWDDIDWDDAPRHGYSRGGHEHRHLTSTTTEATD